MRAIEEVREADFPYLGRHCYLDYTGTPPVPMTLVSAHGRRLGAGPWGNPHSDSVPSKRTTAAMDEARAEILRLLGARPEHYVAIFTANATAAIRLVAEAFPFGANTVFAYTADNHNSVLGIRRYAARAGARLVVIPPSGAELRTSTETVRRALCDGTGLFAFPAQSNFTGVRHPLRWLVEARRLGWTTLLDAASYAASAPLDLGQAHADFVVLSLYKITGYPTGVGVLVARREALARLRRPWFAGGTVLVASAREDWHLAHHDETAFEDGTPDFHALLAVPMAISWWRDAHDHTRVGAHTRRLLEILTRARHRDGQPAVIVHGPATTSQRGPTVAFTILRADGAPVDERAVEHHATAAGVSLRSGCFCNPGIGESVNAMTEAIIRAALRSHPETVDAYLRGLSVPVNGALRASVGTATTDGDLDVFEGWVDAVIAAAPADLSRPRRGC